MANIAKSGTSSSLAKIVRTTSIRPGWGLLSILLVLVSGIVTSLQAPDPQPDRTFAEKSLLEWLRYPVEKNPTLRLPAGPAQLRSVALAEDGLRGLTVGDGGAILTTTDGGDTWIEQDSGVSSTLYRVHCDETCERAWAVGSAGTILTTSDGGKHWSAQKYVGGPEIRLMAVHFTKGGQQGWIVGTDGTVLATVDAGKTWRKQVTAESGHFTSVHFNPDGKRGWAVGEQGLIIATTNGGQNWRVQGREVDIALGSVWFDPGGQRGWAVGYGNTILTTADGGDSWHKKELEAGLTKPSWLDPVTFNSDGRRGWILRQADGVVFRTVDGGDTWIKQNTGSNVYSFAVCFDASGQRGVLVGSSGTILSSSDGGRNWSTRTGSRLSKLNDVHLHADGQRAWAVGNSGIILATNDGTSWIQQTSNVSQSLGAVRFVADGLKGWAVGDAGVILATADGGNHWSRQESHVDDDLHAVHFHNGGQIGWAVGGDGVVLSTSDGGQVWNTARLPEGTTLQAIHFEPGGERGWIAGLHGTIYNSTDRGRTWALQKSSTSWPLVGLWFNDDGLRGWTVGNAGVIAATADGGKTWISQNSGINADLNEIQFSRDAQSGFAVGAAGTILRTKDGGKNWTQADSKVGSSLLSLSVAENGMTGWAVGYPPALLKTSDGGESWKPMPWPLSNQRYPAPWFWLSLIPAAFFLRKSVRVDLASPTQSIEAIGATDAPVVDFARDRLQFGPLARGISRFLRNANTQPPLTIAISGDWGSGKSTLMELVCADLRHYGSRPVWFNAWHHQKEEQLLAALLNIIRDKSLPPIASVDGLVFRLRLLLVRSKKHFVAVFICLAAGSILAGHLLGHDFSEWANLWNTLSDAGSQLLRAKKPANATNTITPGDVGLLIPQLISGAAALVSLYRGLKAFKTDPAVLLTVENFKLKDASAQTSFRSRFAEQFGEVTDALPFTMVIVIDDLDRCQPETVLTVMEAVNFLLSSGKCFVLFGMATHRVQAALGIGFEKVAAELVELDVEIPATASAEDKERAARDRRLAYARDYLDKLINLEIVVPSRSDILPQLLIDPAHAEAPKYAAVIGQILQFWPLWFATATIIIGVAFGISNTIPKSQSIVNVQKAPAITATVDLPKQQAKAGPGGGGTVPIAQQISNRYIPMVQKNHLVVVDRWAVGITLALVITLAASLVLYRLRAASYQVNDSRQFRDALRIWTPVVQTRRGTPRAIKRFGNRLRYLAMLQQDNKIDESGYDELRRWLSARGVPENDNLSDSLRRGEQIEEPVLVALASLHEVYGLQWQNRLLPKGNANLETAVKKAIKSYTGATNTNWPPEGSDLGAFEKILNGIKISG